MEGAVASMVQSNASAAHILQEVGQAAAATDITGFGLLGHLGEMLKGRKGVGARLFLEKLPALSGAEECLSQGMTSSLAPANERAGRGLVEGRGGRGGGGGDEIEKCSKYPLLFDPQTAGGLLASVARERVEATLAALHEAGYAAACVVGEVGEEGGEDGDGGKEGKIELVLG
jgi:selenide,water dikinase